MIFRNVSRELDPWATLARLARVPGEHERALPHWLGVWPVVVLLVVWAWLELVYPAPAEPRLMAVLIGLYEFTSYASAHLAGWTRLRHGARTAAAFAMP